MNKNLSLTVTKKEMGIAASAAFLSAALFVISLAHLGSLYFVLAYLAGIPLFMSGLAGGQKVSVVTGIMAILMSFVMTNDIAKTAVYTLFYVVPSVILLLLALRFRKDENGNVFWYPEGNLIAALTLYPSVFFLLACGYASSLSEKDSLLGLTLKGASTVMAQVRQAIEEIPDNGDKAVQLQGLDNFNDYIPTIARIMPSLIGLSWILFMIVSGYVAHVILKQKKWNIRDNFDLLKVELPPVLVYAVALAGLADAFLPSPWDYMGLNIAVLLCLPMFFIGLGIVHAYARTLTWSKSFLFVFYVALSFIPWLSLILAVLGAVECYFHFRQRFAQLPPHQSKV